MMGDKRETYPDGSYQDNYTKIKNLTDTILIGFTGVVPVIERFQKSIEKVGVKTPTAIIRFLREYSKKHTFPLSTVVIAGQYDKKQLFVVTMEGDAANFPKVEVIIGGHGNEQTFKISSDVQDSSFIDHYITTYQHLKNIENAMEQTVIFAAQRFKEISPTSDFLTT